MAPKQNTFTLVPNPLGMQGLISREAAGPPSKPPMTSKQAQKLYKQATRQPRLSKAEQRRVEREEQERIRKELDRDKAASKARVTRDKKKAKEQQVLDDKKKKGLPLVDVRPSQETISRFLRGNTSGKKRDFAGTKVHLDTLAEETEDDRSVTGDVSDKENTVPGDGRETKRQRTDYGTGVAGMLAKTAERISLHNATVAVGGKEDNAPEMVAAKETPVLAIGSVKKAPSRPAPVSKGNSRIGLPPVQESSTPEKPPPKPAGRSRVKMLSNPNLSVPKSLPRTKASPALKVLPVPETQIPLPLLPAEQPPPTLAAKGPPPKPPSSKKCPPLDQSPAGQPSKTAPPKEPTAEGMRKAEGPIVKPQEVKTPAGVPKRLKQAPVSREEPQAAKRQRVSKASTGPHPPQRCPDPRESLASHKPPPPQSKQQQQQQQQPKQFKKISENSPRQGMSIPPFRSAPKFASPFKPTPAAGSKHPHSLALPPFKVATPTNTVHRPRFLPPKPVPSPITRPVLPAPAETNRQHMQSAAKPAEPPTSTQLFLTTYLDDLLPSPSQEARELQGDISGPPIPAPVSLPKPPIPLFNTSNPQPRRFNRQETHVNSHRQEQAKVVEAMILPWISTQDLLSSQDVRDLEQSTDTPSKTKGNGNNKNNSNNDKYASDLWPAFAPPVNTGSPRQLARQLKTGPPVAHGTATRRPEVAPRPAITEEVREASLPPLKAAKPLHALPVKQELSQVVNVPELRSSTRSKLSQVSIPNNVGDESPARPSNSGPQLRRSQFASESPGPTPKSSGASQKLPTGCSNMSIRSPSFDLLPQSDSAPAAKTVPAASPEKIRFFGSSGDGVRLLMGMMESKRSFEEEERKRVSERRREEWLKEKAAKELARQQKAAANAGPQATWQWGRKSQDPVGGAAESRQICAGEKQNQLCAQSASAAIPNKHGAVSSKQPVAALLLSQETDYGDFDLDPADLLGDLSEYFGADADVGWLDDDDF
ncbi:hypothetical protein B0T25DRAFT_560639 [Lasiosphaeria hispida]|uniref:Uncharacterized protein n=1 Tax=Lasiosphaeria hispida TaxID=260671 RepID=A0AAJ0H562_9PEZI|nr:hypothetical protein B0T25DRAFT_560639 [Lasiosphaeria hispida]